ncbi:hypothetical protein RYH80_00845 [Halobaculum sp. MBLA0147]|uniref:hypothetical protein n=1 Tax=Halobaculum sp. MBLA0147 TaxID=3079934 RepID=UPI00352410E6
MATLLLLAGCGTIGGGVAGDDADRRTVNPALAGTPSPSPTPSPTPSPSPTPRYPTGVGPDGVDAFALAASHQATLRERTGRVRVTTTVETPDGDRLGYERVTLAVAGDRARYRRVRRGDLVRSDDGVVRLSGWATDSVVAERVERGDEVTRYRYDDDPPAVGTDSTVDGRALVYGLLDGWRLRYDAAASANGSDGTAVLVATEPVGGDATDSTGAEAADGPTVRVVVQPSGLIERIRVRYRTTVDGRPIVVRSRFRLRSVGDVGVEPPRWIDVARNRAADDDGSDTGLPGGGPVDDTGTEVRP